MLQRTLFLLLFSLAPVASSLSAEKCVLTGNWTNDLGSNMTIEAVGNKGSFNGTYYTAVSSTTKKIELSPLQGFQHPLNNSQPTFGFTVNWTFSDSTTVFVGQCFMDKEKEVLKTMWLLRLHADSIRNDWNATMIGTNNFTRLKLQE
ncbi:avidin-like [Phalacrocorax carbo]|uniref:avidin-like n=1 Tax=Phalacrocorax carbo TaxID=9209 RepID=UPI003119129F